MVQRNSARCDTNHNMGCRVQIPIMCDNSTFPTFDVSTFHLTAGAPAGKGKGKGTKALAQDEDLDAIMAELDAPRAAPAEPAGGSKKKKKKKVPLIISSDAFGHHT